MSLKVDTVYILCESTNFDFYFAFFPISENVLKEVDQLKETVPLGKYFFLILFYLSIQFFAI